MRVAPIHLLVIAMATEAASAERIVNVRNEVKKLIRALAINDEASMPMDISSSMAAGIEAGSEENDSVTPFVGSKASKSSGKSGKSGKSGSKHPSESPSSDPSEIPSSNPSKTQTPLSSPEPTLDPTTGSTPTVGGEATSYGGEQEFRTTL